MSFFHLPKFSRSLSTRPRSRTGGRSPATRSVRDMAFRRLRIDTLEDRRLLSLTLPSTTDMLVNNATSLASNATTVSSGESTATDPSGDFVVTWSQTDTLASGETESNIYARYFTNEEERIFLPSSVASTNAGQTLFGQFDLRMYGNQGDVQEISISGGTNPSTGLVPTVGGTFGLTYDDPTAGTVSTGAITFSQATAPAINAAAIQTALQNATNTGGVGSAALAGVQVVALDSSDYLVEFPKGYCNLQGNATAIAADPSAASLVATPLLQSDPTYLGLSGFLPGVLVSDYQEPIDVGPISVDPNPSTTISATTGPGHTAQLITQAFADITTNDTFSSQGEAYSAAVSGNLYSEAPVLQANSSDVGSQTANRSTDSSTLFYPEGETLGNGIRAANSPDTIVSSPVQVQVVPEWDQTGATTGTGLPGYSLTNFDVTFVGITADQDLSYTDPDGNVHAAILVAQAQNYSGTSLSVSESDTQILKKPSPQFMVNDPDPIDSVTGQQDIFNKATPAVAMDADGEFVVTWQQYTFINNDVGNQVPQIFAKRFVPTTFNQADPIPDVSAQGTQFEVNATTDANPKEDPAIGMDTEGDFVIAWNTIGQTLGLGNNVSAQRFNFQGNKVSTEFQVDVVDTGGTLGDAKVAMSADGHFGIVYDLTNDDVNYTTWASIYNASGLQILPATGGQADIGGGGSPSIAFDANDDFAIGWQAYPADANNDGGGNTTGTRAEEFSLNGGFGSPVVSTFRANSTDFGNTAANQMWSGNHNSTDVAFDANGDLVIGYQGSGPAVTEDASQTGMTMDAAGQVISVTYTGQSADVQPDSPTAGEAASALIDDYLAEPGNADLNAFNWGNTNPDLLTGDSGTYTSGGSPADILAAMMSTLVTDNPTITTEQEGRARAIIQTALASMNSDSGGSGAVMFSQYTNIPSTSGVKAQGVITSDNLVNATRTGNNATYYIDINSLVNGGTFVLQTTNNRNNVAYSGTVTVDGPGGNTSGPLTVAQIQTTLNSIKAAIAAGPVGTNWPTGNSGNAGPVAVRYVSYSQLADLVGTPWQIVPAADTKDYVFEVTFQDEVQATPMALTIVSSALTEPATPAIADLQLNPAGVTSTPAVYDLKLNPATLPTVTAQWDLQLSENYTNDVEGGGTQAFMYIAVNSTELGTTTNGTFTPALLPYTISNFPTEGYTFASELQSALQNFAGGGETVTYEGHSVAGATGTPANPIDDYLIQFGGNSAGTVVTSIQDVTIQTSPTNPLPLTGDYLTSGFIPWLNTWGTGNGGLAPPATADTTGNEYGLMDINVGGTYNTATGNASGGINLPTNNTIGGVNYGVEFNPANPAAFAAQLQSDFANYNGGAGLFGGGETVIFNGAAGGVDDYLITMGGNSLGNNLTSLVATQAQGLPVNNPPTAKLLQSGGAYYAYCSFCFTGGWTFTTAPVTTYSRGIGQMNITVNGTALPTTIQFDPTNPANFTGQLATDLQNFAGGGETVTYNGTDLYQIRLNDAGVPNNGTDYGEMQITVNGNTALTGTVVYDPWTEDGQGPAGFATSLATVLDTYDGGIAVTAVYNGRNTNYDYYTVAFPTGVFVTSITDAPVLAPVPTAPVVQFAKNNFVATPDTIPPAGTLSNFSIEDDYTITFAAASAGTDITSFSDAPAINPAPTAPNCQFLTTDFAYTLTTQATVPTPPAPGLDHQVVGQNLDAENNPNIAMEPSGSFVESWTQTDADGNTEIYYRQFTDTTDTVGPVVTGVALADGTPVVNGNKINEPLGTTTVALTGVATTSGSDNVTVASTAGLTTGMVVTAPNVPAGATIAAITNGTVLVLDEPATGTASGGTGSAVAAGTEVVVDFDEQVANANFTSVNGSNPANWELLDKNGNVVSGAIASIDFGMDEAYIDGLSGAPEGNNTWQAVITFSGQLPASQYTLVATTGLTDTQGNVLGRTAFTLAGVPFTLSFNTVSVALAPAALPPNAVPTSDQQADLITNDEAETCIGAATATSSPQVSASAPVVATDNQGNYVAVWSDVSPVAVNGTYQVYPTNVIAQLFNSTGQAEGAPINVNLDGNILLNRQPAVAMDPDGDFVVVWTEEYGVGNNLGVGTSYGVFARRFSPTGAALDAKEFRVNTNTTEVVRSPSVAISANGDFVVSWTAEAPGGTQIDMQAYNFEGQPVTTLNLANGGPVQVGATATGSQDNSHVSMNANGEFVVTWQSDATAGQGWDIKAQEFTIASTSSGVQALAAPFQVNTYAANDQITPDVAMDPKGDFVVVWASNGEVASSAWSIYAREYPVGTTPSGEILVTSDMSNLYDEKSNPTVSIDATDDFVVAWDSLGQDTASGSYEGVYARVFQSPTTTTLLPENPSWLNPFQVNVNTAGDQQLPAVAMVASADTHVNGDFVVVWNGEASQSSSSAISLSGLATSLNSPNVTASTVTTASGSNATLTAGMHVFGPNIPQNSMVTTLGVGVTIYGMTMTDGQTTVTYTGTNGALAVNMVVTAAGIPQGDEIYQLFAAPLGGNPSFSLWNPSTAIPPAATLTVQTPGETGFAYGAANGGAFTISANATATASGGTGYAVPDLIFSRIVGLADPPPAAVSSPLGTTVGAYNPATSTFYLKTSNTSGAASKAVVFGVPGAGWQPLNGDWMGDGTQTIGLYNPVASVFYLKNTDTSGAPDIEFQFGTPGQNLIALVGDWTGSGEDDVGLYNPATGTFYLKYSNTAGPANAVFTFGPAKSNWIPIVGDWTGNGDDEVGLYDPTTSTFYLKDTNSSGLSDQVIVFGKPGTGLVPVVGDWLGTGVSSIGLYNPANGTFMLQNGTSAGATVEAVTLVSAGPGAVPSVSQWQTGELQVAATAPTQATAAATAVAPLTQAELQPIVAAAIQRWEAAGASASQVAEMQAVHFYVGNLPDNELGTTVSQRDVYIDATADGYGWFVDPTPQNDSSFKLNSSSGQLQAVNPAAVDEIDLLTVVEHELGHVIGLLDTASSQDSLMSETLPVGVRRDAATDELFGFSVMDDLT